MLIWVSCVAYLFVGLIIVLWLGDALKKYNRKVRIASRIMYLFLWPLVFAIGLLVAVWKEIVK